MSTSATDATVKILSSLLEKIEAAALTRFFSCWLNLQNLVHATQQWVVDSRLYKTKSC